METEAVYVISDESDPEDSSSNRRKAEEDQDPLEGKRILRKKKPKVILIVIFEVEVNFDANLLLILDRKWSEERLNANG